MSQLKELICQKCEQDYPVWYADNEIWNRVCRQDEEIHFLCPTCFAVLAESVGYAPQRWYLGFESKNERFKDIARQPPELVAACERKCTHQLNTEHCSWCGRPQNLKITPEIIRALFYLSQMSRTHDAWEIAKEAPEKAKLILEFIQGYNEDLFNYFGTERQVIKHALESAQGE